MHYDFIVYSFLGPGIKVMIFGKVSLVRFFSAG